MKKISSIVFCFLFLASSVFGQQCSIRPERLQCESLVNPLGIDVASPRLSWILAAENPADYGQRQTAARILVRRDLEEFWDSGWIESPEMRVEYSGPELESDRKYSWSVQVRDENDNVSDWSEPAFWSTGLYLPAEWAAKWLGSDQQFDREAGIKKTDNNIDDPWFRKTFELKEKPTQAFLFLASVGYHELYVNGKRIGEGVLAPCVSDHSRRARYIAYDIAQELRPGRNVIGVWLGTSWSIYAPYATEDKPRTPIFLAQVDCRFADGKTVRVATDGTWKTTPSPNRLLGTWDFGNMGGELYDAGKEVADWSGLGFDDSGWKTASIYSPKLALSAQTVQQNRLFEEIKAAAIEKKENGDYRIDMGRNFVGWLQFDLRGEPGKKIELLSSESESLPNTFRIRNAYILGPSGKGTFCNRFNYHSGRWVLVKGLTEEPRLENFRARMIRTDFPRSTSFVCSSDLQNWLYETICWTFENLALGGYVVDCPQRERMGYGGDAHATSETGMFNYDLEAFYCKWLQDWRDVQGHEGLWKNLNDPKVIGTVGSMRELGGGILPQTAPTYFGGGGPAWGGICVTLPWFLYRHYENVRVLEEDFEMIEKWLAFLESHTKDDLLQRYGGEWDFLGDWLWPGAYEMNNDSPETLCLNNSYFVFNLQTAAKIATVLGKTEQAAKWNDRADVVRKAIHARFFVPEKSSYSDGSMANLAAALLAEVPSAEVREKVIRSLEEEILVPRKGHIFAGITGGALLFKYLRETDRHDLIYSMVSQEDYPSWGFMRNNGATTLWEAWEKDRPGHSLLHSSYLYPGAWHIEGLAGIKRDPDSPGFRRFVVRVPNLKASEISRAKANFDSPVGMIVSDWARKNEQLTLTVIVPPNCKATVYLPAAEKAGITVEPNRAKFLRHENGYSLFEVDAGKYIFNAP